MLSIPASSSGTRLHRGYVEEASLEDKPPLTTHIVFVVHGIGQKMDKDRIIKNTGMWVFRTWLDQSIPDMLTQYSCLSFYPLYQVKVWRHLLIQWFVFIVIT